MQQLPSRLYELLVAALAQVPVKLLLILAMLLLLLHAAAPLLLQSLGGAAVCKPACSRQLPLSCRAHHRADQPPHPSG